MEQKLDVQAVLETVAVVQRLIPRIDNYLRAHGKSEGRSMPPGGIPADNPDYAVISGLQSLATGRGPGDGDGQDGNGAHARASFGALSRRREIRLRSGERSPDSWGAKGAVRAGGGGGDFGEGGGREKESL